MRWTWLKDLLDLFIGLFRRPAVPAPPLPAPPPAPAPPLPQAPPGKHLTVRLTYYYLIDADDPSTWRDFKGAGDRAIPIEGLGERGYPVRFINCLKGEGQAKTKEGVVAWDGTTFRLLSTSQPWGIGAYENPLIPYTSIAVDPALIPLKTKVRCPRFKGQMMPDGTAHDGVLYAADTGEAIKGEHIDLFVRSVQDRDAMEKNFPANVEIVVPA